VHRVLSVAHALGVSANVGVRAELLASSAHGAASGSQVPRRLSTRTRKPSLGRLRREPRYELHKRSLDSEDANGLGAPNWTQGILLGVAGSPRARSEASMV